VNDLNALAAIQESRRALLVDDLRAPAEDHVATGSLADRCLEHGLGNE
jgi:hypothetical protein